MSPIVMHVLAAAIYTALSLQLWRTSWRGSLLNQSSRELSGLPGLPLVERSILLAALAAHAVSIRMAIFDGTQVHFGFAIALSVMVWLAIVLFWIESFFARLNGLLALGLPAAALASLLPALFAEPHILANASSTALRLHLLAAMLAYSLFTLAALHALLMAAAERGLHRGKISPLLASLPPLLTMETILFRLIHIAFVLLTLTLVSGVFFSEDLFGKALTFDHKTVFAIISWLIFAALLIGRHLRGWRGRVALRWTLAGFLALLLAYVGSRFVLEIILNRST
ncbi:cytochrome C biogenesis protein [Rugosibacter aromaticivorans]|uniref:Cytochrome C biogenesis protein n=1 Tax=Rugosibacter aromaticivorans TaxID=1565605 RepID=A0A0C5IXG1_9PROT|nr:cytochrome c biogenesis protein CcsA [Rugosibacter aromaticivorans]AJP47397.1 cytochrome C biogenesis protein [Rugosibacter aromaticivorans]TBR13871.1 MAG: cytochrome C biogenesis protein [Rugosibacter sp.]